MKQKKETKSEAKLKIIEESEAKCLHQIKVKLKQKKTNLKQILILIRNTLSQSKEKPKKKKPKKKVKKETTYEQIHATRRLGILGSILPWKRKMIEPSEGFMAQNGILL